MSLEKNLAVLRETDSARTDGKRREKHCLPDKQKTHHAAQRLRAVSLREVAIRAAGSRHGGAQLGPHHPVTERHQGADQPSENRLGPIHFRQEDGDGEERADPNHLQHVRRCGSSQADAAHQVRRFVALVQ